MSARNVLREYEPRLSAVRTWIAIVLSLTLLATSCAKLSTEPSRESNATAITGTPKSVGPATNATYKGFVYPQCTYTAAYWFDNYPQSTFGFPDPGQNWRGDACNWDVNAYDAGWVVWWGSPNVADPAVRLRLAGAILVWDKTLSNPAGHVAVLMYSDANGATVRESNWPWGTGQADHVLSWSTIFYRGGYRLKGFVLRRRR